MNVGVAIGWLGLIVSLIVLVLLMLHVLTALPAVLIVGGFVLVFAAIAFGAVRVGPAA